MSKRKAQHQAKPQSQENEAKKEQQDRNIEKGQERNPHQLEASKQQPQQPHRRPE